MMGFEEWLQRKQKMGMNWFLTSIADKRPYYKEYDNYRCRAAKLHAEIEKRDCIEVAKELVALGN